ncbi:MAG: hypothetical protein JKY62_03905 [Desulfocapsa sp.]|nr:hypothetical protein [Desulfocapsa sp.]MBN4048753.1 hypothetical protein [bacterium AH-315-N22]
MKSSKKEKKKKKKRQVRAENPSGACGDIGHLTADELKSRAVGDEVDGTCPICGMVHLSRDEIEEVESRKVIDSERFGVIREEAEAATE